MTKRIGGGHSPHKEKLYKLYASSNKRYKNKIKKATKRYGKCKPETLKKVKGQIVKQRTGYTNKGK